MSNIKQKLITEYFHNYQNAKRVSNNQASGGLSNSQTSGGLSNQNQKMDIDNNQNEMEFQWVCLECGVELGYQNPRQLCCKTYCITSTLLENIVEEKN